MIEASGVTGPWGRGFWGGKEEYLQYYCYLVLLGSILWGMVVMCLAAVTDFASLGGVRFLLGFFEGAVTPGFLIVTSNWYRVSEHPLRVAIWMSMQGFANIVGALFMSTTHCVAEVQAMLILCEWPFTSSQRGDMTLSWVCRLFRYLYHYG